MKIEYDSDRDLLYIYFAELETKAAQTVTITPDVHALTDKKGNSSAANGNALQW